MLCGEFFAFALVLKEHLECPREDQIALVEDRDAFFLSLTVQSALPSRTRSRSKRTCTSAASSCSCGTGSTRCAPTMIETPIDRASRSFVTLKCLLITAFANAVKFNRPRQALHPFCVLEKGEHGIERAGGEEISEPLPLGLVHCC